METVIITNHQKDCRSDPGGDLGKIDAPFTDQRREQQCAENPHEQLDHTGDHGNKGIAKPLEGGAVDKEQIQAGKPGCHDAQEAEGIDQHLFHHRGIILDKQGEQLAAEEEHQQGDHQRHAKGDFGGLPQSDAHTVQALCTEILSGKGAHGIADGRAEELKHTLQAGGRVVAGHKEKTKAVDDSLEDQGHPLNNKFHFFSFLTLHYPVTI